MTTQSGLLARRVRALLCLWLFTCSVAAVAAPVKFDIPAQPAPAALQAFIKQSGHEVLYPFDRLQSVTARAVQGEFEPVDALQRMLAGSGFNVAPQGARKFLVSPAVAERTGSIEGVVRSAESSKGIAGARVAIPGTERFILSDARGRFVLEEIPAGTHELEVSAQGLQRTRVTDIVVRAGYRHQLSAIAVPAQREGVNEMEAFVVSAKKNEGVIEMDPYAVDGLREKPFVGGNMDIPRTINDAQPYYIFDAKALDQSGAVNVEDFLKQRLTMNTTSRSHGEVTQASLGNTSSINLRGVGADKTLILVNGRRMPGVHYALSTAPLNQPDLNGIPMSAIERIEVLPSSASGIYGGSAMGGVVNVILKRDYAGGEIRATYDNDWRSDAPKRSVSLSYGLGLEGGRTHVKVDAAWQDSEPILLQDRAGVFRDNLATVRSNSPTFIFSSTTPVLGSLPNIQPTSSAVTTLTLKNGNVALGSRQTHIPAGTSAGTTSADLNAGLLANAGRWNFDFPASTQDPTGLLRTLSQSPETRSVRAGVRRRMLPRVEMFAEFAYFDNRSSSFYNPVSSALTVRAAAPTNPFTTDVSVRVPDASVFPLSSRSQSRSASLGAQVELPWNWIAALDYTWSESRFDSQTSTINFFARTADLLSGALNPFVDTLRHPLDLLNYQLRTGYRGANRLHDLALRGSGDLPALPWGNPTLTIGLERRVAQTPESVYETYRGLTSEVGGARVSYERDATTDSGYLETTIPLVKEAWLPGVHSLDLQLSGRSERYEVDTGTPFRSINYNVNPPTEIYGSPTLNGKPYFAQDSYSSSNYTVGLKYQPVPEVTLRVSRATAFLPPSPADLLENPVPSTFATSVLDPVTGRTTPVFTVGGGNPNLKPQNSESFNAGVIWEPRWRPLAGLRLNVEYYRIEQFDYISSLSAQAIVNAESIYPDRVVRDAGGTITQVNTSLMNLYHRDTAGWDVSASYGLATPVGRFRLSAVTSIIRHLKDQYALDLPEADAVGFPSEGGAAKYKGNATLNWEWRGWTAGWTARYFGSYRQYGAAGGFFSTQYANGGVLTTTYIDAGGGDTVPSQTYHDLYVGRSFGARQGDAGGDSRLKAVGHKLLDGLSVQLNVRNVFDKVAPLDPYYGPYYLSPYGGGLSGLRSYVITVKKAF